MADLSVVIINFKTKDLTLKCLQSIFQTKPKVKFEVWLVDNHSEDDTVELVKRNFPWVKIIESDKNVGFAGGNNLALERINSRYSLLLNSDTEIKVNSLDMMVYVADTKKFDILSCKLLNKDGSLQPNGGELPAFWPLFFWLSGLDDIVGKAKRIFTYHEKNEGYYQGTKEMGWVGGTAMLIKNDVCNKIGFLDNNIFMYGEDVEFCLRAKRAGFKIGWTDKAVIMHLGGGSSKEPKFNQWKGEFKGLLYIYKKYYGRVSAIAIRFLFYLFILLRIISFAVLGKIRYAQTYAKVIVSI